MLKRGPSNRGRREYERAIARVADPKRRWRLQTWYDYCWDLQICVVCREPRPPGALAYCPECEKQIETARRERGE